MPEREHVTILLDAESGSPIRPDDVRTLFNGLEGVLKEIEASITGEAPRATWVWGEEEYHLPLTASANGVTFPTLTKVGETFREVFGLAAEGGAIEWPVDLSDQGRRAAQRILKTLDHLDALTITTSPDPSGSPIRIESAEVSDRVGMPRLRRAYSTVEGYLASLSDRVSYIRGRVIERGTRVSVICHFPLDLGEQVSPLFRHCVVLTGETAYDDDGNPRSVVPVVEIEGRERTTPLVNFIGSAPSILGERELDGFLYELRGPSV